MSMMPVQRQSTSAAPSAPEADAAASRNTGAGPSFPHMLANQRQAAQDQASSQQTRGARAPGRDAQDKADAAQDEAQAGADAAALQLLATLLPGAAAQTANLQGGAGEASGTLEDQTKASAAPRKAALLPAQTQDDAALANQAQKGAQLDGADAGAIALNQQVLAADVTSAQAASASASAATARGARPAAFAAIASPARGAGQSLSANAAAPAADDLSGLGNDDQAGADFAATLNNALSAADASGTGNAAVSAFASAASFSSAPASGSNPSGLALQIATPVGEAGWGQAMAQQVSHALQAGATGVHQAEMRLDPPDLGPLRVTLQIQDNVAHAWFVSPHASVRQAVESALPQLAEQLAQAGLSLGGTHVGSEHAGYQQQPAAFGARPAPGAASGDDPANAAPAAAAAQAAARPASSNLLDTYA
jgi:flagellar hook-length control protein FliK